MKSRLVLLWLKYTNIKEKIVWHLRCFWIISLFLPNPVIISVGTSVKMDKHKKRDNLVSDPDEPRNSKIFKNSKFYVPKLPRVRKVKELFYFPECDGKNESTVHFFPNLFSMPSYSFDMVYYQKLALVIPEKGMSFVFTWLFTKSWVNKTFFPSLVCSFAITHYNSQSIDFFYYLYVFV